MVYGQKGDTLVRSVTGSEQRRRRCVLVTGPPVADPERLDRALGVLADSQRRATLRALAEEQDPIVLGKLPRPAGVETEECRETLYHVHLPKLAEAGYVSWKAGDDEIRPGPQFGEAVSLLRALPGEVGSVRD